MPFVLADLLEDLDATRDERRAFQRSMAAARGDDGRRPDPVRNPYYDAPREVTAKWRAYQPPEAKDRPRAPFPSPKRRRRLPGL